MIKFFMKLIARIHKYFYPTKRIETRADKPKPIEMAWNPFCKYPPNEPCYCDSGLKYKKCCKNNEAQAIPKDVADQVKPLVKKIRGKRK